MERLGPVPALAKGTQRSLPSSTNVRIMATLPHFGRIRSEDARVGCWPGQTLAHRQEHG
jgi:hypothetical protein